VDFRTSNPVKAIQEYKSNHGFNLKQPRKDPPNVIIHNKNYNPQPPASPKASSVLNKQKDVHLEETKSNFPPLPENKFNFYDFFQRKVNLHEYKDIEIMFIRNFLQNDTLYEEQILPVEKFSINLNLNKQEFENFESSTQFSKKRAPIFMVHKSTESSYYNFKTKYFQGIKPHIFN
jgi:hypothetical protein